MKSPLASCTRPSLEQERSEAILQILSDAKSLAVQYRLLTGKPLGITGEVAEYEAARLLGLELMPAGTAGYDAIRGSPFRTYQIKGRCLRPDYNPAQRIGRIDVKKHFDAVLLVLLHENFEAFEIYEAERAHVVAALNAPGSKARNERGALSVGTFIRIGQLVWPVEVG